MLSPRKVKFRKQQKGRVRGLAQRATTVAFGEVGLKAVESGKITSQQIEAARIAMMRHIKRGGKSVYPHLSGQNHHGQAPGSPAR